MQSTLENNVYIPTVTSQTFQFQPQRNVCPGCGKCNVCGRPNEIPNSQPNTYPYPATWITGGIPSTAGGTTAVGGFGNGTVGIHYGAVANSQAVTDATGQGD